MNDRTPRPRHRATLAALFLLTVLAACAKQEPPPPPPPEVSTVSLAPERVLLTTDLPGRTAAYLVAEIRPQVSGLLLERRFAEGADVKEGELLYRIDPAQYKAAVDQAEAAHAMAVADLPAIRARAQRVSELAAKRVFGEQDKDDAQAALLSAEARVAATRAALDRARIDLGHTPVTAPISGRIGKSNVTVGALVAAYQPVPLAVIQKIDPIYVDVPQSSADWLAMQRRLASGNLKSTGADQARVRLLLEDGTPYPHEGTLKFRDITVNPVTGAVNLRMVFPNREGVLLPGMYVRAVIQEGIADPALLVPQEAVTRNRKGEPFAWVVGPGGVVEQRALVLDREIGARWLVARGVAAGDEVIVDGLQKTRPGRTVRTTPFVSASIETGGASLRSDTGPAAHVN